MSTVDSRGVQHRQPVALGAGAVIGVIGALAFLVVVFLMVEFVIGTQVQRVARCQQLSDQYVATLNASQPTYDIKLRNERRDAYARECG